MRQSGQILAESFPLPARERFRVEERWRLAAGSDWDPDQASLASLQRTGSKQDPVPFNLTLYKGAKSYYLPRRFVQFLLTHPVARAFLAWAATTAVPDETVVASLARVSRKERRGDSWWVEQQNQPRPHQQLAGWRGQDQALLSCQPVSS